MSERRRCKMKPKVSDEIKAKLLAGLYEDLMPKPPPKPKAEIVQWPKPLSEMELDGVKKS